MYFFNAEKQGSYFEGWTMRRFAFDTKRRHMYYTECEKGGNREMENGPLWKKKFKVTRFIPIATVHEFHLDDPHLKEADFFTMEIHGRTRRLGAEEPPKEPLLSPSTGPSPFPSQQQQSHQSQQQNQNGERSETLGDLSGVETRDPFELCELYEVLRDEFTAMRRENMLRAVNSSSSVASQRSTGSSPAVGGSASVGVVGIGGAHTTTSLSNTWNGEYEVSTLTSPRSASAKERHITAILRCQSEYDFRRLWFVLQTVLGYDRLDVRPYRGLPPYDPRNGIPFAHVPMHLWHTFHVLEKSVFYTFLRGDLVGRGSDGNLQVSLPGAYLCITHDMLLVMRSNGSIPRWVRLQDVHTFEFNTVARRPFFAFLTDDPAPDVLFIPSPPLFGPTAIANFSAQQSVHHVKCVLQETCFLSEFIRRAIRFTNVNWAASVRGYYNTKEKTRHFKFTPLDGFDNSLSCLIPKVQLAKVWREVILHQRSRSNDDIAAIPLEGEAAAEVNPVLSTQQLHTVRQQMGRQQARSQDEIVGVPLDALLTNRRERTSAALETPVIQAENVTIPQQDTRENQEKKEKEEEEQEEQEEIVYQQPGACYLSRDASLMVVQPNITGAENHFGPESHVVELVNTSLVAIGGERMEK
ncbi:uncharacterized protein TM35_000441830 [Trypanosoma theileri]|uniref:Uncharacterized protein n=1 Tax=Trypanosoma theileri TaxID=67003 RepID=A0A1X0NIQ9_9TRYP|nr:uncharacterized protein TM35_000441830 [Trypanosoma theileri]ORC84527.1 hypothetical protein TM35_000441830 [Trypanosoma theileri]